MNYGLESSCEMTKDKDITNNMGVPENEMIVALKKETRNIDQFDVYGK